MSIKVLYPSLDDLLSSTVVSNTYHALPIEVQNRLKRWFDSSLGTVEEHLTFISDITHETWATLVSDLSTLDSREGFANSDAERDLHIAGIPATVMHTDTSNVWYVPDQPRDSLSRRNSSLNFSNGNSPITTCSKGYIVTYASYMHWTTVSNSGLAFARIPDEIKEYLNTSFDGKTIWFDDYINPNHFHTRLHTHEICDLFHDEALINLALLSDNDELRELILSQGLHCELCGRFGTLVYVAS